MKQIVIPDTVTEVHAGAFCKCAKLEKVQLSSSMTVVEFSCFEGTAIKAIKFPRNIETIEEHAFKDCEQLTYVECQSKSHMKNVDKHAFDKIRWGPSNQ